MTVLKNQIRSKMVPAIRKPPGLFIPVLLISLVLGCAARKNSYVLSPAPSWYQHWLRQSFVDADQFRKEGYSTLEALGIQNLAIKMVQNKKSLSFDDAVLRAKKEFVRGRVDESGYLPQKNLGMSDFIVAFDLDETLLAQWYRSYAKGAGYYDICTGTRDVAGDMSIESTDCIKFIPGLEKALLAIKNIPGCRGVAVFTAKGSVVTNAILDKWNISGKPARDFFAGVFTRGYLSRGGRAFAPSKDLRVMDESLAHVIIIDDSPEGLFQVKNLRAFPKFNADVYLPAKGGGLSKEVVKYYETLLQEIVKELEDTYRYSEKNRVPFAEAFYPYSQRGFFCARMIQDLFEGYSKWRAADFLRSHNDLCEPEFYGTQYKGKN